MKILINRSDAIGDLLLTLPVLKAIKKKYPSAEIGLLISPRTAELIKLFPELINRSWIIQKKDTFFSKFSKLQKIFNEFNPEYYLYIGGDTTANTVAMLKGVPFRGGLLSKASTFLTLNNGVRQRRSKAEFHESQYNLNLLEPMDIKSAPDLDLKPHLINREQDLMAFRHELEQSGFGDRKQWIIIHPGMTGHTLNWPMSSYAQFTSDLAKQLPEALFIISHTPSDKKYIDGFKSELPNDEDIPLFYFDGTKHGLLHYVNILSNASLFLGPSTGNTHMANMLGINQIAIYSPIKVQSAARWGPLRQDNRVQIMHPMVECAQLESETDSASSHHKWMASIATDDVVKAALKLLNDGDE